MAEVIELVAKSLAGRDDVERTNDGYCIIRCGTRQDETTTLTFRSVPSASSNAPLIGVAVVETRFVLLDWGEEAVAWLNRRAALGSFLREGGAVTCRLSYPLYCHAPDARVIATYLVKALERQRALGLAITVMDSSEEGYRFERSRLTSPRHWTEPPPAPAFDDLADVLRPYGAVSTSGSSGVTVAVPLIDDTSTQTAPAERETAEISLRTDVQHPLAGTGYCATMTLTRQPTAELLSQWCALLNALEHRQDDFAPRLGAWGIRDIGTRLVYGMFWPTDRADATTLMNIAHWMIRRALWIRRDLWSPGIGLHFRTERHDLAPADRSLPEPP